MAETRHAQTAAGPNKTLAAADSGVAFGRRQKLPEWVGEGRGGGGVMRVWLHTGGCGEGLRGAAASSTDARRRRGPLNTRLGPSPCGSVLANRWWRCKGRADSPLACDRGGERGLSTPQRRWRRPAAPPAPAGSRCKSPPWRSHPCRRGHSSRQPPAARHPSCSRQAPLRPDADSSD